MENSLIRGSSIIQKLNDCPAIDSDRKLQMQYSILTIKWKAYQDTVTGNQRRRVQIEHNMQMITDLEAELNSHQLTLEHLRKYSANMQAKINQIHKIEENYHELSSTITQLENEVETAKQNLKNTVESAVEPARRTLALVDQQFDEQLHQWEEQSLREMNRLRKLISQKRDEIGTVRVQMCLQLNKAKDELRRSFADQLRTLDVHVDCRSVELELKREVARLQRKLLQLESPAQQSGKTSQARKKAVTAAVTEPSPRKMSEEGNRKRKLFNISSNYLDF